MHEALLATTSEIVVSAREAPMKRSDKFRLERKIEQPITATLDAVRTAHGPFGPKRLNSRP